MRTTQWARFYRLSVIGQNQDDPVSQVLQMRCYRPKRGWPSEPGFTGLVLQYDMVYYSMTWCAAVWHYVIKYCMLYYSMTSCTTVWHSVLQYDMIYNSMTWFTTVWNGVLQYELVYYSMTWYTTVWHGLLQYKMCLIKTWIMFSLISDVVTY